VAFQKIEPFKVFDNLYYVGPGYVSVWLLTTPDRNILFDTAQEPYVDYVIGNIRKVGVDPRGTAAGSSMPRSRCEARTRSHRFRACR